MKSIAIIVLMFFFIVGCQAKTDVSSTNTAQTVTTNVTKVVDQTVEVSCGQCQFGMEGSSCDLAVRIDGKPYFVDGSNIDDHGDAHGEDGLCNCIRKAKVTGEIKDGQFVATDFLVLPNDK